MEGAEESVDMANHRCLRTGEDGWIDGWMDGRDRNEWMDVIEMNVIETKVIEMNERMDGWVDS